MEKKNKKKTYKKKLHTEKKTGILEKNKAGFGFVRQEEDGDIFISKSNMGDAMHGDLVEVDLLPEYLWRRKNREGIIDKVLERAHTEVVGTFQKNKRFGFVVPDDARNNDDIFVKKADFRNAQSGFHYYYYGGAQNESGTPPRRRPGFFRIFLIMMLLSSLMSMCSRMRYQRYYYSTYPGYYSYYGESYSNEDAAKRTNEPVFGFPDISSAKGDSANG